MKRRVVDMNERDYKLEASPKINTSNTDVDSIFGVGVVTGNRELECEHVLCITLCSTTCTCSSSSSSIIESELNQVKKVS